MKLFTHRSLSLIFLFTAIPGWLFSQVTFTNQGILLSPISGSGYQDCAVDMNHDNLDDVVRVTDNGIYIDYQQADGTFEQTFFSMAIQNPPNWSICAGDIDGNGFNDLLFGNGNRVSFCYANEDGTAYSEDAHPEYIFSQRSTFADIDNDGNLDAFVNHDVDQSHPYRNDGNGNLVLDQTLIETLPVGGNYAAIWVDYDNDWDTDLYITKCRGGAPYGDAQRVNLLYRNNGDGTFTSAGPEANLDDGNQGWTTIFEDFDNDGDFDAFIINHASDDVPGGASNLFMDNNGDGTFTDIIDQTGINAFDLGAWDGDAGDFNNDGFIDIFSQLTDELYLNNGDGTFTPQNLSFNMGGIGDFNDDGFLDVINENSLWINDGNDNNWIKVGCEGLVSNRNGIGARLEIYGDWGMQIREIRAGESFRPASSLVEHFGIGTATEITQLVIKWPSGYVTTIDNPDINSTYIVTEADCITDPNVITVMGYTEICEGSSVELVADEGLSYTWSTGDTTQSIVVDQPGAYSVVIWDIDDCASMSNVVIVSYITDESAVITVDGDLIFCEGQEVTLTSSPGESYLWSNGDETQSIVATETGVYEVTIVGLCTQTPFTSDPVALEMLDAAELPIVEDVTISEPGVATLTASGENLLWYDDEFAGEPVGAGDTFETEFFETQISYWVEANAIYPGVNETGGKEDNSGGGGISPVGGMLLFDAYEDFTIKEVTVYVLDVPESGAGIRNFTLYDFINQPIATYSEFLDVGENIVSLNFDVPASAGYSLGCDEDNLFRNNNGVNYPYNIGTKGTIISSSQGSAYYYYFYNWKIETDSFICPSERVEVSAIVGIEELSLARLFNLYPNPANATTRVSFGMLEDATVSIYISDIIGKTVYQHVDYSAKKGENTLTFDVSLWSPGIYQLNFGINGQFQVIKFIVE